MYLQHCTILFYLSLTISCVLSTDPQRNPSGLYNNLDQDNSEGGSGGEIETSCLDGAFKPCKVFLPSHNGIISCFIGERECLEGEWGECKETRDGG